MRKSFKIKNLIRNKFQRNIFLNSRRSLLLYIGHKLSRNGARYIPSPLGEKVAGGRMRGHKGIVESRQHRYAILSKGEEKNLLANEMSLQILGGGQLCASQQYLYVMLNLFQHLATVEFHGSSKRLPQRRNIGQTLNQVVSDYSGLHSQSTPLYFAVAKWSRRLAVCSYGLGSLRSRGALPKILQGDVKSHSDLIK